MAGPFPVGGYITIRTRVNAIELNLRVLHKI